MKHVHFKMQDVDDNLATIIYVIALSIYEISAVETVQAFQPYHS